MQASLNRTSSVYLSSVRSRAVREEGLPALFTQVARAQPDEIALIGVDGRISYRELDTASDTWAARLAASGVHSGHIVPIVLPRSPDLVIALLAVLKAGAAYAALDPAWPVTRLREAISLLDAPLLVAGKPIPGVPTPVWSPPAEPVDPDPRWRSAPVLGTDPCCVFFTSGTTGKPKAVLSPHQGTARLFRGEGIAPFGPGSVIPLAAPSPWDAFSLELWSALLTGGTSLIIDEPYLSAGALRAGVSAHGVTAAWLTSSLFNMIVDEDLSAFSGLRLVMTGGERLSPSHCRRFLRRHPDITLLNGYGPVESTVFATTHRITERDCDRPGGIPLGRPVPGTDVYVLRDGRPCGPDEIGEICLAGDGLALRYLADPVLTEEKFPWLDAHGCSVRIYRTGDLGAWDADGLLHFHGRADRQLKIRGHRIEPAEVESQVERLLPEVRDCRVLARRDDTGAAVDLVAFCVPTRPGDPLTDAVPKLRAGLVAHHRPALVIAVEAFPITAQGKLDEAALLRLAPPVRKPASPAGTASGGGDDLLRAVTEAFREVLGDDVPVDRPFTDLGGNSLDGGRVCARLAARLGRPVPVSALYAHPSVVELASWLRATAKADIGAGVDIPATEVPLTPMQLLYLAAVLANPVDRTGHCLLTWVIEGELDRSALRTAIVEVHRRHEPLRAAYTADPRPVARLTEPPAPALEVLPEQPSVAAAVTTLRSRLADALDVTAGRVWTAALAPLPGEAAVFGCVVHHIAFDGWSEAVLADDLAAAYAAARAGRALDRPAPPPMAQAYRAYADRLAWTDLDRRRADLRRELADLPMLRWPAGGGEVSPEGPRRLEVALPPAALARVDARAAAAGVTRFVVLLADYARALAEVTGERDLPVGVPVAQRDLPGLERAVGCHLTTLCLRLRAPALDPGPAGVAATAELVRQAFAAQDVPFSDQLRMVPPRTPGRPPLFQTMFALQDSRHPTLNLPGARTTFIRQPYLDIGLELVTEVWPNAAGGPRLAITFKPGAVTERTVRDLADGFVEALLAETEVPW